LIPRPMKNGRGKKKKGEMRKKQQKDGKEGVEKGERHHGERKMGGKSGRREALVHEKCTKEMGGWRSKKKEFLKRKGGGGGGGEKAL